MPLGFNTQHDIGIRRITGFGLRNFELNGTQLYVVVNGNGYDHAGNHYAKGQTVAYDASGGTAYNNTARLERDFNRGALDPAD